MKISFDKYHGCGNDFIIINNLSNTFPNISKETIKNLCDRNLGIGADGLILINECKNESFEMVYYNSDGKISTMCGNGGRCAMHYSSHNGISSNNSNFLACDGLHNGEVSNDYVRISLQNVEGFKLINDDVFMDTGSPHIVKILKNIFDIDILKISQDIQKSENFKSTGVNVNFVSIINDKTIQIRTYERGVEDETLSCGTGAVAAALTLSIVSNSDTKKVLVKTKGGDLFVEFKKDNNNFYDIYLSGKVKKVFSGNIDYEKN